MESPARKKTALLFGSFNPIHEGHLAIGRFILEKHPEVELRYVVSPESPFKSGLYDSADDRLAKVRKAVEQSVPGASVSDVEFTLPRPLYTINTLRHLRQTEADTDFILVVGGDNIASIETWHEGVQILKEFEVWAYPRTGYDTKNVCLKYSNNPEVKHVEFLDGELYDISSTEIRSKTEFDVIVIGGGITGAGTARDCAMRGLTTLLLEKGDYTNGATGRNHGLLHSGARYAIKDPQSAKECITENKTIRKIAPHCIETTGGLFISLPEDGLEYQAELMEACSRAGIETSRLDPKEALAAEPALNSSLAGALAVPDCTVDPFKLTLSNIIDAQRYGAVCRTKTIVTGFLMNRNRIIGVKTMDVRSGEQKEYYCRMVVNSAGIWGMSIAAMAGIELNMYPAKGSLLVFEHRLTHKVINRCRPSADADILVPGGTVSIIGTTSLKAEMSKLDDLRTEPEEVNLLLSEGTKMVPGLADTRILRAYAGVRPLVSTSQNASGREISRGVTLIDHSSTDGVEGFITITGGKLTTYRLMAEQATDMVCKLLGVKAVCRTAVTPLPDPMAKTPVQGNHIICECEFVTEEEIKRAINELGAGDLDMLRRRTRLGMGTCQGQICSQTASKLFKDPDFKGFIRERWKGIQSVAWGETLREAQLAQWRYNSIKNKS